MAGPESRFGFVALLGRPNVGKSTLMNRVLGEKIAITSPKPQTTRNRILGIDTVPGAQTVYVDTPGLHSPGKALNRRMVGEARRAAEDSDIALMMIEAHRPWMDDDLMALDLIEGLEVPRLLAINKIDKVSKESVLPLIDHSSRLGVFEDIVPLSALKGDNVGRLAEVVRGLLPEGERHFPGDILTDRAERFWVAEVIREKIVRLTRQELPYSAAVVVERFEEKPEVINIGALILVERDSQKGMIIGKKGSMLKKIGTSARADIERFLGARVFLELFVRVEKDWWRDRERMEEMGFDN